MRKIMKKLLSFIVMVIMLTIQFVIPATAFMAHYENLTDFSRDFM